MRSSPDNASQRVNFYEVANRLGIEWDSLAPGLIHAIGVRRCQKCRQIAKCRAWLDSSMGRRSYPPNWCPNVDLIVEVLYDHPAFRAHVERALRQEV